MPLRGLTIVDAVLIRQTPIGRLAVSPRAIAQIAERSLGNCYGVVGLGRSGLLRRLQVSGRSRGVRVRGGERGIELVLRVVVAYGLNLAEVASTVRSNVSYEIERLTGLEVERVEVEIEGIKSRG